MNNLTASLYDKIKQNCQEMHDGVGRLAALQHNERGITAFEGSSARATATTTATRQSQNTARSPSDVDDIRRDVADIRVRTTVWPSHILYMNNVIIIAHLFFFFFSSFSLSLSILCACVMCHVISIHSLKQRLLRRQQCQQQRQPRHDATIWFYLLTMVCALFVVMLRLSVFK